MIALPPGVRVYLACGVTDMRNYAECLVMRSARLGASIAAVYPAGFHVRLYAMNGLGKVYVLDRNYTLTK